MTVDLLLIVLGALAGGFVNGLTGFGLTMAAMPFWLPVLPPVLVGQLAAAGGLAGQLRALPTIAPHIRARAVLPFVLPGVAGIPVGLWLAPAVPAATFRPTVGVLMVLYSATLLMAGSRVRLGRTPPLLDLLIGFGGGVLGGLAGLSGVLPGVWGALKSMPKDDKRALFQAFNMTVLGLTAVGGLVIGRWTWHFVALLLLVLPLTLLGNALGLWLYRRIDGVAFDRFVLAVLLVGGVVLAVR